MNKPRKKTNPAAAHIMASVKAPPDRRRPLKKPEPYIPERVKMLHEGANLTNGDRDVEYGPPEINMAASGAIKKAFRDHMNRDIGLAELEALDMVMTKLGRIATGTPKRDTYVDAATYFAIAGEIALKPATGFAEVVIY